jgi:adenylate kinase family enzyme
MKKIMIIGSGGAGKSTLARAISEKINIEVYHLDALLWKPNWKQVSKEQQRSTQEEIVQKEEWIIDGNYGGTMDVRFQAADTIIFMDIHRIICVYRAIKRSFQYRNKTRPDMVEGNKERFALNFYQWIWHYPKDKRPEILKSLNEMKNEKDIIMLKSPKEVKKFIEML